MTADRSQGSPDPDTSATRAGAIAALDQFYLYGMYKPLPGGETTGQYLVRMIVAHPEARAALAAWLVPGVVHGSPHTHDDDGSIRWIRYPATQPEEPCPHCGAPQTLPHWRDYPGSTIGKAWYCDPATVAAFRATEVPAGEPEEYPWEATASELEEDR